MDGAWLWKLGYTQGEHSMIAMERNNYASER